MNSTADPAKHQLTIYSEMLEHLEDAVFSYKPGGNFLYLNPGAEKIFGYSQEEGRGLDFQEIYHGSSSLFHGS
jgi:PAS domain S-box-containing protein